MENVVARAPYATTAIPLYLSSLTGTRYRSLNCMECGQEFLERNNDMMYRTSDDSQPNEIHISSEQIIAVCGNCSQQYSISVSMSVSYEEGIPLYLQPQSIYFSVEPTKSLRYLHCLECGKTFQTISDRVSHVSDNRIPFNQLNPLRLGPIEQACPWNRCGQIWSLMVS